MRDIEQVCLVRYDANRQCKQCKYYGYRCEHYKKKHKNMKPRQWFEYKYGK